MLNKMTHNSTTAYVLANESTSKEPPLLQNFARNEDLALIEIAVQATIFIFAVFGNGAVILTLSVHRNFRRMTVMIMHLCAADLFVAFFNILPQIAWDVTVQFRGDDALCRSVKYLQVVAMYASSYVLVTTAIDRYLAICHPLVSHTWTSVKIHALVATAWIIALVMAIPQLTIFAYRRTPSGRYDCWAVFEPAWTMQLYITWITVAIYVIPSLVLFVVYGRICYVVWQSMTSRELSQRQYVGTIAERTYLSNGQMKGWDDSAPRTHVRRISRAKVKTVKLTLTVIICYLICWGPFFISQMWAAWDPYAPFEGPTMVIILLLASLNSCTNPWIYLAFSNSLRLRRGSWCSRNGRSVVQGSPLNCAPNLSTSHVTRTWMLSANSSMCTHFQTTNKPSTYA